MKTDTSTVTEEGYVYKDAYGQFLRFVQVAQGFGRPRTVAVGGRLVDATVYPSKSGPADRERRQAITEYLQDKAGGAIETLRIVRTTHISATEYPLLPDQLKVAG